MLAALGRKPAWLAGAIVILVGVTHRSLLFFAHKEDLDRLIAASPDWYSYQHLPMALLRDHLLRALAILQQTPPVSNLLVGLALKWYSWPGGVAYALIALQAVVSLLAAATLVHLVAVLYPGRPVLWTIVGLVFVLNTDLVVLEYNSFGQTLYGPLAMLLVLIIVDRLVALRDTGRLGCAVAAGAATGLLALTRATWSFFALPAMLLAGVLGRGRRAAGALAFAAPILVLQGGWALKNQIVYGVFSPATSTWGGMHAIAGLNAAGLHDKFTRFVHDRVGAAEGYPAWAADFARGDPTAVDRIPAEVRARDRAVERASGFANPLPNTLFFRTFCAVGQRAFIAFVLTYPRTMLEKWRRAYGVFWQPIANYGRMFVDLFAVSNRIIRPFDFVDIAEQLARGTLPDTAYVVVPGPPRRFVPISLYTLRWAEVPLLVLNLIGVHLLLPLLTAALLVRWVGGLGGVVDRRRLAALVVAVAAYGYLAGLVNLIETAENMRYRLEVEPVIWVITLICVTELAALARATARAVAASARRPGDTASQ